MLQCTDKYCSTLQRTEIYVVPQDKMPWASQRVTWAATHCNTQMYHRTGFPPHRTESRELQHTATNWHTVGQVALRITKRDMLFVTFFRIVRTTNSGMSCNTLQHTATHCCTIWQVALSITKSDMLFVTFFLVIQFCCLLIFPEFVEHIRQQGLLHGKHLHPATLRHTST